IYSYGVLMWEISSGVPPFKELISKGDLVVLRLFIIDGHRENVIEGTPEDYKELYEKCWNSMPENRPNIKKVLEKFKKMGYGIYEEHNSTFEYSTKKIETNINYISSEELLTNDLNRQLNIQDDLS
ncbi:19612_t:CDS:2, partial [Funneliformis geosporum]